MSNNPEFDAAFAVEMAFKAAMSSRDKLAATLTVSALFVSVGVLVLLVFAT